MSIFQHFDYRQAIRSFIDETKSSENPLNYGGFAEAIGVQKTFVSKVLNLNAHLSDDHLHLACNFLKFTEREKTYLRVLYDFSRTGLHSRKVLLKKEIHRLQEENRQLHLHTRSVIQKPESNSGFGEYYLDPMNLVVHAYLGIEGFQKRPESLYEILPLTPLQMNIILDRLERLQIISRLPSGTLKVLEYSIHLDLRSIFCGPHQMLFRVKSTEQIMRLPPESRFIYGLTFSANTEIKQKIQELFLQFTKKVENLIDENEKSDQVFQINFDLFPWVK